MSEEKTKRDLEGLRAEVAFERTIVTKQSTASP